jgi:hypothetical protein
MSSKNRVPMVLAASVALVLSGLMGRAVPAANAQIVAKPGGVSITGTGPLSEIDISNVGTLQVVDNRVSTGGEFYPRSTDCGASLGIGVVIGVTYYGPTPNAQFNCSKNDYNAPDVAFQPYSQTFSGSGTAASPYIVVTTVTLTVGLRLTQIITYVTGQSSFREDVSLQNTTGTQVSAKLYAMSEPDPGSNENGYGYRNSTTGVIGASNPQSTSTGEVYDCSVPGVSTSRYYVLLQPITPFSHYVVGLFSDPFSSPKSHASYPDTTNTLCQDVGAGGEWDITLSGSSTVTVSNSVVFASSKAGQGPPPVLAAHGGTFNGAAQCFPPTPPNASVTCGASQNPPYCPPNCTQRYGGNAFCTIASASAPGGYTCWAGTIAGNLGGASYTFKAKSGGTQPAGPCTTSACPDGGTITFYGRGVYNSRSATLKMTASDDDVNLTDAVQMTISYTGGSITAYWTCSPASAGNCSEVRANP